MVAPHSLSRRTFLAQAAMGTLATAGILESAPSSAWDGPLPARSPESPPPARNKLCAFVKFLQSMENDALAKSIAALGFDGIEATVRDQGQVLPAQVVDDLPPLVEALARHGLEITVMASSVNRVDQPHTEKVLRTAAGLGITKYRMAYYRYDEARPIVSQLDALRPVVRELAALNRELGLTAVYQNHAGNRIVGASVWDLRYLLQDIDPSDVGVAFDIRHATVEGGMAWPIDFGVIRPHLGAVYVKDFVWDGRKPKNVPLGAGRVDASFFKKLKSSTFTGPISLHVEYLPAAGIDENTAALRQDLKTLQALLA